MQGIVTAIYLAPRGGEAMESVAETEAYAGRGLRGDRYLRGVGFYSGTDECEVTLIESEALEDVLRQTGIEVLHGEHRRNIVTSGVRLAELKAREFSVGEAVLAHVGPRPPCRYLESLTEPGMMKALTGGRAGICARVVTTGLIRVGDPIRAL